MVKEFVKDQLDIKLLKTREDMGGKAARDVAQRINALINQKKTVNMIFAAAPSQNEFLEELMAIESIDWSKVVAFHLDEYVNLGANKPQRFGNFLKERIFDKVDFKEVFYIDVAGCNNEQLLIRYATLLKQYPLDIACIGIGENGHIAFNDPHVADFVDPKSIKIVDLDEECRTQQVNDGCFSRLEEVPTHAYTVTISTILSADYIYCMVPGSPKSKAVKQTVKGTIETACPASALRSHQRATLYLDKDSASLL